MDEDSLRYEGWRVAAASGGGVFLASLVVFGFPVLLKPLAEEFSWSREQVSSAYGMTAIMSAVASAPLGYLLDRWGARRVVLPCLVLFGSGFASLFLLTPRLWHLYGTFALLGIAVTGTSPIAYARAISTWFDRRRGLALAVVISGASVGAVLHPPAIQALVGRVGWRVACLSLGGLVFAVGLSFVVPFLRARPTVATRGTGPSSAESLSMMQSLNRGLRSRTFWILIVVLFCASVTQNGTTVHMVALLTDRGVSSSHAAIALSCFGLANVLGRLLTGWLIDRVFAARVSFALLAVVALGAFLLSGAQSLAMGVAAAVLIGFGIGGESDITPYLLSRYFGLQSFSTLYGFAWIATASAGALGPILMGRAFDATGSYESLLVTLGVVTLAAATMMLGLPRYQSPQDARAAAV